MRPPKTPSQNDPSTIPQGLPKGSFTLSHERTDVLTKKWLRKSCSYSNQWTPENDEKITNMTKPELVSAAITPAGTFILPPQATEITTDETGTVYADGKALTAVHSPKCPKCGPSVWRMSCACVKQVARP